MVALVRPIVRKKAKQLCRRSNFSRSDREDVEQELMLQVLKRLKQLDAKSRRNQRLLRRLVRQQVASLLEHRSTFKSNPSVRLRSLSEPVPNDEYALDIGQTVSEKNRGVRLGRARRSQRDQAELRLDLGNVLSALPEDLVELAERLKRHSLAAIARQLGVPRTTLQYRVRKLRRVLEFRRMEEYFLSDSSGRREIR